MSSALPGRNPGGPAATPRNPYIAGRALSDHESFLGRTDILRLVETVLSQADQSAIVLFGQRRIGKTSVLLQLRRRLPCPPLRPVYFDLMDRARKPLGTVLYELASTMAEELNLPQPNPPDQTASSEWFREQFLPLLFERLGTDIRPVILFDEFDVLDVAAEERLPDTAAARAFFPFLRRLMESERRLAFVFVVGRKAEDLSIDVKATFKAARYQRVSVLDPDSARRLVGLAETSGTLVYSPAAIDRILDATARHPYFTQLMCQLLFDRAHAESPTETPRVDVAEVEAVIPSVIEAGENVFEWVWDGLPPAERVIFSAVAEVTGTKEVISEEELTGVLQRHGIRILIRELELAPKTLIEWEMLRHVNGGYGFFIELMRQWVALRKPLPKVKNELDRINPIADQQYQLGNTFYRLGSLGEAVSPLRAALLVNPNHLKARLLLGEALREQGLLDEALKELEEAYRHDEDAARYPLVRALLVRGEESERGGRNEDAMAAYQRVLAVSPREGLASDRLRALVAARGEADIIRFCEQEDWDQATAGYRRLVEIDPHNARWSEGLKSVEAEATLARRYAEGLGAQQQGKLLEAQRAFADVVGLRPDYREAAERLAQVVRQPRHRQRLAELVAAEKKGDTHERGDADETPVREHELFSHADEALSDTSRHFYIAVIMLVLAVVTMIAMLSQ